MILFSLHTRAMIWSPLSEDLHAVQSEQMWWILLFMKKYFYLHCLKNCLCIVWRFTDLTFIVFVFYRSYLYSICFTNVFILFLIHLTPIWPLSLSLCAPCLLKILEGRSYPLQHPWVGIVNRSQADINKNVDMIAARRREHEFFATSPDYGHLATKMGSEYLAKLLSKVSLLLFLLPL